MVIRALLIMIVYIWRLALSSPTRVFVRRFSRTATPAMSPGTQSRPLSGWSNAATCSETRDGWSGLPSQEFIDLPAAQCRALLGHVSMSGWRVGSVGMVSP